MNNSQFRKLVLDTPARKAGAGEDVKSRSGLGLGATPSLGSRMRSSIPMTPRSVGLRDPNSFAHQLALQNQSTAPQRKFRATKNPKGSRLAEGYTDRTKQRQGLENAEEDGEGEGSEKFKRVKALEEMMKLGQIDEKTFEGLREEILGDEVGERAGLVKGLDRALLERVRRGEVGVEDVLEGTLGKGKGKETVQEEEKEEEVDEIALEDEFDKLEEREVEVVAKEREKKKGEMAPPSLTGKKRNRDQILAEMKAQRAAAKAAQLPSLGAKFRKVGERRPGESRIERDSKGREVLITIDEDGNEKRKVRKVQAQLEQDTQKEELMMPDKDAVPLGMIVPELPKEPEEDDDMDIFEGAGDDYDPLAGMDDSDSDDEGEVPEPEPETKKPETSSSETEIAASDSMVPPPPPPKPQTRNYFGDSKSTPVEAPKITGLNDPTLLAALKKASTLAPISTSTAAEKAEELAKAEKLRKMLAQDDRDAEDMDMGFGSSRFEDEADFEEKKIKLSEWGKEDKDEKKGKGEKKERKRGGKPGKRKGDGNSFKDVMDVIEGRKKAEGKK